MANFTKAYIKAIQNEGGYVNNPADKGGETYKGISRKYHPNAKFWKTVDALKKNYKDKSLNSLLEDAPGVDAEIKSIYKTTYWDIFTLDNFKSQLLSEQIFNTAINMGVSKATKLIQKILNLKQTGKLNNELLNKLIEYGK